MAEEIESLEDHANLGPFGAYLLVAEFAKCVAASFVAYEFAINEQISGVVFFKVIDAAQERALARPTRSNQAGHVTLVHDEIDTLEDQDRSK